MMDGISATKKRLRFDEASMETNYNTMDSCNYSVNIFNKGHANKAFTDEKDESDYSELATRDISSNSNEGASGSVSFQRVYDKSPSKAMLVNDFYLWHCRVTCKLNQIIPHYIIRECHYTYSINVTHGDFEWTLKKRRQDFINLNSSIKFYKNIMSLPIPTRTHMTRRRSYHHDMESIGSLEFPKIVSESSPEVAEAFAECIVRYLNEVLEFPSYRSIPELAQFLEISTLSFLEMSGPKGKEGAVSQLSGGHIKDSCFAFFRRWKKRWLIARDTYILYMDLQTGLLRSVILFDRDFDIRASDCGRNGVLIVNMSRELQLELSTEWDRNELIQHVHMLLMESGRCFKSPNRFESFAPPREQTLARWQVFRSILTTRWSYNQSSRRYVDGAMYMEAVANSIENAQHEIFIADWWLSPEIYLKRPVAKYGDKWRLDKLLLRKACEGVQIFVMLYKETFNILKINSAYSKRQLMKHPNIHVVRSPNHLKEVVFLWAHHEKLVIVDQKYGFLGGIDLCFGRWDDHTHRLTDIDPNDKPSNISLQTIKRNAIPELIDSTEAGLSGFKVYDQGEKEFISIQTRAKGGDSKKTTFAGTAKRISMMLKMKAFLAEADSDSASISSMCSNSEFQIMQNVKPKEYTHKGTKFWIGKDYINFISKDIRAPEQPFEDLIDRHQAMRMPWHDIGAVVIGKAARDLARHFIQRWNTIKNDNKKEKDFYPWLIPKSYDSAEPKDVDEKLFSIFGTLCRCEVQVLRSSSLWSGGIRRDEKSIQTAYLNLICKAVNFIYIENQFFISMVGEFDGVVNVIANALFERIVKAAKKKQKFRVYIVLPLLPAFEGELGTSRANMIRTVLHYNYAALCRGESSLYERLKKEECVDRVEDYLGIYSLRKHDVLYDIPITEQIYVHSKLIIADDAKAIIGSANINDRSMNGTRDSEIAVVISDEIFETTRFNGRNVRVGAYVSSLRRSLFREHLGMQSVDDPVSDDFFNGTWNATAARNTEIFEEVFNCWPSDKVENWKDLRRYQKEPTLVEIDSNRAKKKLKDVIGHLVMFPTKFLCQDVIRPRLGYEQFLPNIAWV